MKKFFLLFKKELGEMLTPQLWIPFLAVIVVFFIIGNVANKQTEQQSKAKQNIAISDMDNSQLSSSAIDIVKQIVNVETVTATDGDSLISTMKEKGISVGIIIPEGFQDSVAQDGAANLQSYTLMNDFSVLAGKKLAIGDSAIAAINEMVSSGLIDAKLGPGKSVTLKNPISVKSYVSANGKIEEGSSTQLLGYILGQTTTIPIVLFVVIVMASQMIASAVATEKENKTLETLLSLPVSRKIIVTSKMLSAGLVSLIMATIYMFGIKSLNGGISTAMTGGATSTGADVKQIAQELGLKMSTTGLIELGVILFLAILLALAIAMILGAFSEDAKSAQGVVAPLMILVMIPYFVTLFMDINALSAPIRFVIYAIPFSHVFLAMPNILLGNHIFIAAGAAYMFVLFVVFVLIAAKIFSSDLILTMKLNFSKKKK